jgi:hypothetical protein
VFVDEDVTDSHKLVCGIDLAEISILSMGAELQNPHLNQMTLVHIITGPDSEKLEAMMNY